MARYLEVAHELGREIEKFIKAYGPGAADENQMARAAQLLGVKEAMMARDLGYIVNLAVRCSPRAVQGTVRKNIVEAAVGKWCRVAMTKGHDEQTGRDFNKISITER